MANVDQAAPEDTLGALGDVDAGSTSNDAIEREFLYLKLQVDLAVALAEEQPKVRDRRLARLVRGALREVNDRIESEDYNGARPYGNLASLALQFLTGGRK